MFWEGPISDQRWNFLCTCAPSRCASGMFPSRIAIMPNRPHCGLNTRIATTRELPERPCSKLPIVCTAAGGSQVLHNIVARLRDTGRLPAHFITKREAHALGWRPGIDLAIVAPGRVIGGDKFHNREGHLLTKPGRYWYEVDLNDTSGARTARRLLFSSDGLFFVTIDHYSSFTPVLSF